MHNNADYLLLIAQRLTRLHRGRQALLHGNDTEALHDFRVDLRSLRTLLPLALSSNKQLDKAILQAWRSLAKLSNAPRDAEVMMGLLGTQMSIEQQQLLQKAYNTGINQLLAILLSERLTSLIHTTLQQTQHRLSKITPNKLKRRISQQQTHLCQSLLATHRINEATLNDWHQRRIIIKQLRYLNELASDWLKASGVDLLPTLKTAQSSLGDVQDQYVLRQWLQIATVKKSHLDIAERDWKKLIRKIKRSV